MKLSLLALLPLVVAQCPNIAPQYPLKLASGYQAKVVINGLKKPRHMVFDSEDNLLVVEQNRAGIRRIVLSDDNGLGLNNGIELSADGKTLFATTASNVYAYSYNAKTGQVGTARSVIGGMAQAGHQTRTVLVPKHNPDLLLVSRGSIGNIDEPTTQKSSGRSMIKIFKIADILRTAVDYTAGGTVFGWGLRNSVGMDEEPVTGTIWSVENSVDRMERSGADIHNDNPGEELNYHGLPNDTSNPWFGGNYGYPRCVAVWDTQIQGVVNPRVGKQIVIGEPGPTYNDDWCASNARTPRLTFQAHVAPLDIKFRRDGRAAYMTWHGSWNRDTPVGYAMTRVDFKNGQPGAVTTSKTAAKTILSNQDLSKCPGACMRPTGLAYDSKGRLFMSSGSTGEIFVILEP